MKEIRLYKALKDVGLSDRAIVGAMSIDNQENITNKNITIELTKQEAEAIIRLSNAYFTTEDKEQEHEEEAMRYLVDHIANKIHRYYKIGK